MMKRACCVVFCLQPFLLLTPIQAASPAAAPAPVAANIPLADAARADDGAATTAPNPAPVRDASLDLYWQALKTFRDGNLGAVYQGQCVVAHLARQKDAVFEELKQKMLNQYREAERLGSAKAASNLGNLAYEGDIVKQDFHEAYIHFEIAAGRGSAESQRMLGQMHERGEGVPITYREAVWPRRLKRAVNPRRRRFANNSRRCARNSQLTLLPRLPDPPKRATGPPCIRTSSTTRSMIAPKPAVLKNTSSMPRYMRTRPVFCQGALALLVFCCVSPAAPAGQAGESVEPDPRVETVRLAALSMQRKSWEQGILAQAFLEEGRDELVVAMARASLIYLSDDGVPAALGGAPVDPLMAGEAVARAVQVTGDAALREAVDRSLAYVLHRAPRAADGTIFHTGETIWSDSFNTTPPFLACTGYHREALAQIEGHWRRLWNPRSKLLAHIWDEKSQRLTDPNCWGGGNGWAAAGLTRVIRAWPGDDVAERTRLVGHLRDLIDGCLAHQRSDGLFHDVIDDPRSFVETNLAQMLAFSIYESVRGGWLPADYLPAADRMRAAARSKVDRGGFVRGVSGAPAFDCAGVSPEGQAFFLMMEAAARKLPRNINPL